MAMSLTMIMVLTLLRLKRRPAESVFMNILLLDGGWTWPVYISQFDNLSFNIQYLH